MYLQFKFRLCEKIQVNKINEGNITKKSKLPQILYDSLKYYSQAPQKNLGPKQKKETILPSTMWHSAKNSLPSAGPGGTRQSYV
jgi:hypothetical protein